MEKEELKPFTCSKDAKNCFEAYQVHETDPFSKENPNGSVCLSYGENLILGKLLENTVRNTMKEVSNDHQISLNSYKYSYGELDTRKNLKEIVRKLHTKDTQLFNEENLILTNGCTNALVLLLQVLCPRNVLLFKPIYIKHKTIIENCGAKLFTIDNYNDQSIEKAITENNINLILLTNPTNPEGKLLSSLEIEKIIKLCIKHNLQLISDEILSSTVFKNHQNIHGYVSAATVSHEINAEKLVHLIGGFSKFGLSGLNVGYIATKNEQLIDKLRKNSYQTIVGNLNQQITLALFKDWNKVLDNSTIITNFDNLLMNNQVMLRERYSIIRNDLFKHHIPFIPAESGVTIVLDFTDLCETFEDEFKLWKKFISSPTKVILNRGEDLLYSKPGYFRMCFTFELEDTLEAIKRIGTYLNNLEKEKRHELIMKSYKNQLKNLWETTDFIFSFLKDGKAVFSKSIDLRHPFVFYIGHLPCFAWNIIKKALKLEEFIDVKYDELFQRGIDPDVDNGSCHKNSCERNNENWPSIKQLDEYKNKCRTQILHYLPKVYQSNIEALEMLIEHELMHQETLLYMFQELDLSNVSNIGKHIASEYERFLSIKRFDKPLNSYHLPEWVKIQLKEIIMGVQSPKELPFQFGWDNEFPSHKQKVDEFEISSLPVNNRDYLEFIDNGGYKNKSLWDEFDWDWIQKDKIEHPSNWKKVKNGTWTIRQLFSVIPIEKVFHHPVFISHSEAKAYAKWKDARLATEAELLNLIQQENTTDNIDFTSFGTQSNEYVKEQKIRVYDLISNGFEWTNSPFNGFEGFKNSPLYPEYSSDFFDGKHYSMLGGSWATQRRIIRPSFRNWFQTHYRFMFSKVRLVRDKIDSHPKEFPKDLNGLKEIPKHLPSYLFYDKIGSEIFEDITKIPEYYLTKCESQIIQKYSKSILEKVQTNELNIIELGAGSGEKTELLLKEISETDCKIQYIPIDISEDALIKLQKKCEKYGTFTKIVSENIQGLKQYYSKENNRKTLILFLGSSIGNYNYKDGVQFFKNIKACMKKGDYFLIGFDLKKETKTMIKAYDDDVGVTSAFNINLLKRLNKEFGSDFDVTKFKHFETYNPHVSAMESWLISLEKQTVQFPNCQPIIFKEQEYIHMEISSKYSFDDIQDLARESGFEIIENFMDDRKYFVDSLWRA